MYCNVVVFLYVGGDFFFCDACVYIVDENVCACILCWSWPVGVPDDGGVQFIVKLGLSEELRVGVVVKCKDVAG